MASWNGGIPPAGRGGLNWTADLDEHFDGDFNGFIGNDTSLAYSRSPCLSCRARRARPSRSRSFASLPWVKLRPRQLVPRANSTKQTFVSYWPAARRIWFLIGPASWVILTTSIWMRAAREAELQRSQRGGRWRKTPLAMAEANATQPQPLLSASAVLRADLERSAGRPGNPRGLRARRRCSPVAAGGWLVAR